MMQSAAELLDQIRSLRPDEQYQIVTAVLDQAVAFDLDERRSTAAVLQDRSEGPFVPYDEEMFERVKARGRQHLGDREDGSAA